MLRAEPLTEADGEVATAFVPSDNEQTESSPAIVRRRCVIRRASGRAAAGTGR